jgi:hypothetical protein
MNASETNWVEGVVPSAGQPFLVREGMVGARDHVESGGLRGSGEFADRMPGDPVVPPVHRPHGELERELHGCTLPRVY